MSENTICINHDLKHQKLEEKNLAKYKAVVIGNIIAIKR